MIHIQNPVYYHKFRHSDIFLSYSDIFSHIMAYLVPSVTLTYSEAATKGLLLQHIKIPEYF